MASVRGLAAVAMFAVASMAHGQAAVAPAAKAPTGGGGAGQAPPAQLENKLWKGDFDQMLDPPCPHLGPYCRSLYFVDKGRERGIAADLARDFEQYLNKKYAKQLGKRPLTVIIIVTTRDKLLPGLADGLGDISAGNLTVTEERLKLADFVAPTTTANGQESSSPDRLTQVATLDDLSGKTIHLRKAQLLREPRWH